jgi:DNA-binding winged helix-turn-helix (wHTH) protein
LAVSVRFGPFIVNPQTRQLLADETEIHLSTKAFDLLCALIERRPDVIPKAELLSLVWPNAFVVEANLNVLIGEIRRALDDDPRHPQHIRTVHGIGYAFCGDAIDEDRARRREPRAGARFWIVWKERTFVLSEGDNVIGRHPECNIWLDEAGVSRRHARIHVDGLADRVVLEDLNSTNGTCVRHTPIAAPYVLTDGDVLQVGSVELTFRTWAGDSSRETERIHRKRG